MSDNPGTFKNGNVRKRPQRKYVVEKTFIDPKGGSIDRDHQWMRLNRYMVDVGKLRTDRVLLLKYCTTRQISHKIKKQMVSVGVQRIILDLIVDDKFERVSFDALSESDKQIVKAFCDASHIDIGVEDIEDLNEKYQILLGQYRAGNEGSKVVLKRFIEKQISLHQVKFKDGFKMLDEIR